MADATIFKPALNVWLKIRRPPLLLVVVLALVLEFFGPQRKRRRFISSRWRELPVNFPFARARLSLDCRHA
jgi:hypothetical protein